MAKITVEKAREWANSIHNARAAGHPIGKHLSKGPAIVDSLLLQLQQQRERVEKEYLIFVRDILSRVVNIINLTKPQNTYSLTLLRKVVDRCEAALKELEATDG